MKNKQKYLAINPHLLLILEAEQSYEFESILFGVHKLIYIYLFNFLIQYTPIKKLVDLFEPTNSHLPPPSGYFNFFVHFE